MYMTDFEMLDRNTMDLFKINDSEHYCDSNKIAVCSILMKPPPMDGASFGYSHKY